MGVRKGTDNFAGFRRQDMQGREALIRETLQKARKRGILFADAQAVAEHIYEKTGIHRTTTLIRNMEYKKIILLHLASQPGASHLIPDDEAPPEVLRAKIIDLRLEISRKDRQMEIMTARIDALQARLALPDRSGIAEAPGEEAALEAPAADWHGAFADTAMLLILLMERLNDGGETVRMDFDTLELIDLAASPAEQRIAGPERTKRFAEYYAACLRQEGRL